MKKPLKKHIKSLRGVISVTLVALALFFALRSDVVARLSDITSQLTIPIVAFAFFLAVLTHLASATRFFSIISAADRRLRWFSVLRANVLGSVFGMVVVQMVGQMAGRQTILHRYGISPATLSLATLIERFILAGVGGLGALLGTLYLIGFREITAISLPEVILTPILILLTLVISYRLFGSDIERRLVDLALSAKSLLHIFAAFLLTCLTWAITLLIFVVLIRALQPDVGVLAAISASAIISFAAALPISVNGWGVREISAVWVLGILGFPAPDALVVSIGVGLLSTISIFVLLPLVGIRKKDWQKKNVEAQSSVTSFSHDHPQSSLVTGFSESAAAWILGLGVACLIFFQVTIGIEGTLATVSLADLLALAACAFLLLRLMARQPLPALGSPIAYPLLTAVTAALLLALAIGAVRFGPIEWAIGNRAMGWLLLLGYFGAGALIAEAGGRISVNRVVQTMVIAAALVCIAEVAVKIAPINYGGMIQDFDILSGFYENRNAHSFLMLFIIALSPLILGNKQSALRRAIVILACMFSFLLVIGSRGRSAIIVLVIILPVVALIFEKSRQEILLASAGGLALFFLWEYLPQYGGWLFEVLRSFGLKVATAEGMGLVDRRAITIGQGYDTIRWELNAAALAMWREYPIFGAGLGAFMESQIANPINEFGPHVVHNTWLWLLAEFGLVGTLMVTAWFAFLAWQALIPKQGLWADWQKALFLCLLVFGAYSMVHEIFYQRIFWFATGLLLAFGAREQSDRNRHPATADDGFPARPTQSEDRSAAPGGDHSTTVR